MCQSAAREISVDAQQADSITRLLEHSRTVLNAIDCLLTAGDALRDGARDEVALQVLASQIAYGKTRDWKKCVELLEQAAAIVASASARARLEENPEDCQRKQNSLAPVSSVRKGPTENSAQIEVTVHGDVQRKYAGHNQLRTTWNYRSIPVPRCAHCAAAHRKWANTRSIGFLVTVLSVITYLTVFVRGRRPYHAWVWIIDLLARRTRIDNYCSGYDGRRYRLDPIARYEARKQ